MPRVHIGPHPPANDTLQQRLQREAGFVTLWIAVIVGIWTTWKIGATMVAAYFVVSGLAKCGDLGKKIKALGGEQ